MPSLTQLLTIHDRLLVLDAASKKVQAGLLRSGEPGFWCDTDEEAGTGIFANTDSLLKDASLNISDIGAFVFCEGPGSMLGIRIVAMALRTWQALAPRPVYAYRSLALAGHFEWTQGIERSFTVIADARRDLWHCQAVGVDGRPSPLRRVPATAMPAGELVTPGNFRAWAPPPRPTGFCGYELAKIFPVISDGDHFRAVDSPDTLQLEAPGYKKWSAQIHSAATAGKR